MNDRIFNQRLYYHLRNFQFVQFLVYLNIRSKFISISCFLNKKIVFNVFQFFFHTYHASFITNTCPHKIADCSYHPADIFFPFFSSHPVNGIQYIVKKMRIDLCLQCLKFYIFIYHFHLDDLLQQLFNLLNRLIENRIHRSDFICSFFREAH